MDAATLMVGITARSCSTKVFRLLAFRRLDGFNDRHRVLHDSTAKKNIERAKNATATAAINNEIRTRSLYIARVRLGGRSFAAPIVRTPSSFKAVACARNEPRYLCTNITRGCLSRRRAERHLER